MGRSRLLALGVACGLGATLLGSATAAASQAPTAPPNLRLQLNQIYLDSLALQWDAASDRDSTELTYEISRDDGPVQFAGEDDAPFFGGTRWFSGLAQGAHTFVLRARDEAGNVSPTTSLTVTMPAPPTPQNVRVTSRSGDGATLDWDDAARDPRCQDCFTSYAVFVDGRLERVTSDSAATVRRLRGGDHAITVTTRFVGATFRGSGGPPARAESSASAPVRVSVAPSADRTPPTPPGNPRAVPVMLEDVYFSITWDQSVDDVTPQSQIEYDRMATDSFSGALYVQAYAIARGTGGPLLFRASERVLMRAADAAGNVSVVVDMTAGA